MVDHNYGGVGFICRKPLNCNIKEIPQDDDRISVIQIVNNGQIRLTIVGTYLPFFSGTSCEQYNETLDKIHAIIDNLDSPVILLGDMNAQLPQQQVLSANWYRQRPFNKHSVFLHDFLGDHNMISANFSYKQNINHTYFSGTPYGKVTCFPHVNPVCFTWEHMCFTVKHIFSTFFLKMS